MRRATIKDNNLFVCTLHGVNPTKKKDDDKATFIPKGKSTDERRTRIAMKTTGTDALMAIFNDTTERVFPSPSLKLIDERGAEYPETTDVHCCWDRYPFENHPVGIPIAYENVNGSHIFHCIHIACSLECAFTYLSSNSRDPVFRHSFDLIEKMHKIILEANDIEYSPLEKKPDWNLLKTVGQGEMSITEFRKDSKTIYSKLPNVKIMYVSRYYQKCQKGQ